MGREVSSPRAERVRIAYFLSASIFFVSAGLACGGESVHAKQLSLASDSNRAQLTIVQNFGVTFEKEGFFSTLDSVESAYEVTVEALLGSDSYFSEIENKITVYKKERDAIQRMASAEGRQYPADAFWGVNAYGRTIPPNRWGDEEKAWKAVSHHVIVVRKGRIFGAFRFQSLYGSHPIGSDMELDQRAEAYDIVRGIVARW